MRIHFLVIGIENKIDKKTLESLENVLKKELVYTYVKTVPEEIHSELYYKVQIKNEADFICLLPNESEINENFLSIIKEYMIDDKSIYLPLVVLTNSKFKSILNTCVWNADLVEVEGELDHNLALKQIDTTLYGALIPKELFYKKEFYKEELKYYQHFHFLNNVTKEAAVIGIPKTLLYTNIDLSYASISNEEKMKNFKLSKELN